MHDLWVFLMEMLKNFNKIKSQLVENFNGVGLGTVFGDIILGCAFVIFYFSFIFGIKLFLNWFLALSFILRLVMLPTLFIFFFFYLRSYFKYEKKFYFQDLIFFLIYVRLIVFFVNFFLTFFPLIFYLIIAFFENLGYWGFWLFLGICLIFFIFLVICYKKWRDFSASFREIKMTPFHFYYISTSFEQEYLFQKMADSKEHQYLIFFFKSRFFLLVVFYLLLFSGNEFPGFLQFLIFLFLLFASLFFFYPDKFLGEHTEISASFYAYNKTVDYVNERLPVHERKLKKSSHISDINSFILFRNKYLGEKYPLINVASKGGIRNFSTDWPFAENWIKRTKWGKIAVFCTKCVLALSGMAIGVNQAGYVVWSLNESTRVRDGSLAGPLEHTSYMLDFRFRDFFSRHDYMSVAYKAGSLEKINDPNVLAVVHERINDGASFQIFLKDLYAKNKLPAPVMTETTWDAVRERYALGVENKEKMLKSFSSFSFPNDDTPP